MSSNGNGPPQVTQEQAAAMAGALAIVGATVETVLGMLADAQTKAAEVLRDAGLLEGEEQS